MELSASVKVLVEERAYGEWQYSVILLIMLDGESLKAKKGYATEVEAIEAAIALRDLFKCDIFPMWDE